jgi:type VI secretion system protein ImpA
LLDPITPEEPCGKSLEETGDLALLDAYQIFGQDSLDPVVPKKGDPVPKETRKGKSDRPPNWAEIADLSVGTLAKSKDLRVLAHLSASVLWLDGPRAFVETLSVASKWLSDYWPTVFPLIDEDAIFRRNALNCLADRAAVIEGVRRAPLVSSRQHGRFSLRDLEMAAGAPAAAESEAPPEEARIAAAFAEMPLDDLKALAACAVEAVATLGAIDEVARRAAGIEAAPSFDPLVAQFQQMDTVLRARLALHPANVDQVGAEGEGGGGGVVAVGAIRSRQDAIRALDAAAEFFRRNEPSSPVPLIVDRAKRLISKDFLEVIADVAPEALASARAAGGIRD